MGVWKYFTVDDEHMELERKDYLASEPWFPMRK